MIVVLAVADARAARRAGADAVVVKSLAAIVRRTPVPPNVTERALKAHAAALARLEKQGLSLLPVRFGTVAKDERELRRLLSPLVPELQQALALTRNRRQMTVRVRGERAQPPRTSGRAFIAARAREARVHEADPVRKAVAPFVIAEQTGAARPPFVGAIHHLIAAADVARYASAVAALQRESPGRFLLSGPMPPFAFATAADIHGEI
ncbi:MAG: GvpL/GvpF family gas vesicle protein [Vicinamibacterales bacterium]